MVDENTSIPEEAPKEEAPKSTGAINYYKEQLEEMKAVNAKLLNEVETSKTAQLQEKENYKQLWENEKGLRVEAESKSDRIQESYFNGLKNSAIETFAVKHGIRDHALADIGLLDKTMVQIETTSTGNANVIGADEFVESLKLSRPHWFSDGKPPLINGANPEPHKEKVMTAQEVIALEKTDPIAYRKEMQKRIAK